MKKLLLILCMFISASLFAEDINAILKEADNFEKQQKENEALDKYSEAASLDSTNMKTLVKCVELNCRIGARQADKTAKNNYYQTAVKWSNTAYNLDSNSADANYLKALVAGKLIETSTENKATAVLVREAYTYSNKALAINPDHGKANYILGKWNYEMLNVNWFKKTAMKTLYGGLPKADIDSAINHMEKCRTAEPYFVLNYLDLAKAYKFKSRPAQAIEVLNKLVKLPTRTADDVNLKAEGKQMLDQMQ